MEIITGIYKITSPSNKIYIGQSINIFKRISRYYNFKKLKEQRKLFNSFAKYGVENHKFEIIHICKKEELDQLEIFYIDKYKSFSLENPNIGLNLTKGGQGKLGIKGILHSNYKKPMPIHVKELLIKINTLRTGINNNLSKTIYQYDLEGNFIKEWVNNRIICETLGFKINACIAICCLGISKSYKNFRWFYEYKGIKIEKYKIQYHDYSKLCIYVYDIFGNYLNKYNSINIASKKLNISNNIIKRMINKSFREDCFIIKKDFTSNILNMNDHLFSDTKNSSYNILLDLETGIFYDTFTELAKTTNYSRTGFNYYFKSSKNKRYIKI